MMARDAAIKLIRPELLAEGPVAKADQVQRRFEPEARDHGRPGGRRHTVEPTTSAWTEEGVF